MLRKLFDAVLAFIPTLMFNIRYFGFLDGLKLPVIVSHRVWLKCLAGSVEIGRPIKFGMVKIGFQDVAIFDRINQRSIWSVRGKVVFAGRADLGHGTKISVGNSGKLVIGSGVRITAESVLIVQKGVVIGDDSLISWDTLLMDTDFHEVRDAIGNRINEDEEIILGKHVWVGCRSTILKGCHLADGTVIAAGTVVTRSVDEHGQIVGGYGMRILANGVNWTF